MNANQFQFKVCFLGQVPRTSALPGSFDESTTGPAQKTHYDNTEDTTKDPDNPAADGAGSRHNYTVIGQTGLTYDNNRNVLADGTREFRYSYNNQLRRVWRKSDGQSASNGLLAKYREDAFGRRVYAESYWELSRRDVMDTRFSVDVNVDADGDGTAITYVNGGITATDAAPPGQTDQRAQWDSRIRRPITITNEAHYFDFDITVPTGNAGEYLGFIAYDRFELRIFQNRYELWDSAGPTLLGWTTATTVGRHNIGLRAGQGWGVWVDGSQLTLTGGSGSMGLIAAPQAKFGTHPNANGFAITLWENLCYLKSYSRASAETIPAPGVPVVDVLKFDGPRPCVIDEVFVNSLIVPKVIDKEDGTSCDVAYDGSFVETQLKPNGREHVADVIQPSQDAATYDSTGNRSTLEEPQPGSAVKIHVDGTGALEVYGRFDPLAPVETPAYGQPTSSFNWGGGNEVRALAIVLGPPRRKKHEDTFPPPSSLPEPIANSDACRENVVDVEATGDGDIEGAATTCLCQGSNPAVSNSSHGNLEPTTGQRVDQNNGNGFDPVQDPGVRYYPKLWKELQDASTMLHADGTSYAKDYIAWVRAELRYWKAALFKTSEHSEFYQGTVNRIRELQALEDGILNDNLAVWVQPNKVGRDPTAEENAYWKAVGDQYFYWQDLWAVFNDAGEQFSYCLAGNVSAANSVKQGLKAIDEVFDSAKRGLTGTSSLNRSRSANTRTAPATKPTAKGGAQEYVDLTDPKGRTHILDGEPNGGGGHRAGTGRTGKTEFPTTWSDDKIIHEVSDMVTDPNVSWGKPDKRGFITGTKFVADSGNGVTIKLVYDTKNGRVVTAYPINEPKNP